MSAQSLEEASAQHWATLSIGVARTRLCAYMRTDKRIDMCMDMCIDMCAVGLAAAGLVRDGGGAERRWEERAARCRGATELAVAIKLWYRHGCSIDIHADMCVEMSVEKNVNARTEMCIEA